MGRCGFWLRIGRGWVAAQKMGGKLCGNTAGWVVESGKREVGRVEVLVALRLRGPCEGSCSVKGREIRSAVVCICISYSGEWRMDFFPSPPLEVCL